MEKSSAEVSLSTAEEMQRRLARSSSLSDHSRYRSEKRVEKLEDYLDTNLLSAIRATIGVKRERGRKMKEELERDFDWPVDELKAFEEGGVRREKGVENGRVGYLADDNDVIDSVDEDEVQCSQFRLFEETALKRVRGEN